MNRRSLAGMGLLLVISPALARSQTVDPLIPTREDITRLQRVSDGYAGVVVQSLHWKTPASQYCTSARARIGSMSQPTPGVDQPIDIETKKPFAADQAGKRVTPEILLEIYQRTEENTMARHAILSQQIYEAVRNDCLIIPDVSPTNAQ